MTNTALALLGAYTQAAQIESLNLLDPTMLPGMLIGAMLPYLFAALTIDAVGRAAQQMIEEVRRQFREIPGLREGKQGVNPDSARCVAISTEASLREMILPGSLAVVVPLVVGFVSVDALGGLLGQVAPGHEHERAAAERCRRVLDRRRWTDSKSRPGRLVCAIKTIG